MVLGRGVFFTSSAPVLLYDPRALYVFSALVQIADILKENGKKECILDFSSTMLLPLFVGKVHSFNERGGISLQYYSFP